MPMPTTVLRGNILFSVLVGLPLSPVSVAANTSVEQTFAFPGLLLGVDYVTGVSKPTTQAGLSIGNTRVAANGSVAITFVNSTGSPIVPTAGEVYTFNVDRFEDAGLPLPTGIS